MSDIFVRFDKQGFYHPAYGRLGRGKAEGFIYRLPAEFGTPGELPSSAEILDRSGAERIVEESTDEDGKPELAIRKPKVVDEEQLDRTITGAGRQRKPQSAIERTAPSRRRSRRTAEK